MLLGLSLRYFIHNHRRTIKGVKIIALGIIIVSSSGILIEGFGNEITQITELLGENNDTIVIKPSASQLFSTSQQNEVLEVLQSSQNIIAIVLEYTSMGIFKTSNQVIKVPIHITNLTQINELVDGSEYHTNKSQAFFSSDLVQIFDFNINKIFEIGIEEPYKLNSTISLNKIIQIEEKFINSGIYLDTSILTEDFLGNMIQVQFENPRQNAKILEQLFDLEYLDISDARPEAEYLRVSVRQITTLLLVLQTMISILVVFNIWNLFQQLLYESKFDIRVLLSIGYSKNQVRSIYMVIASSMGFISFILSTIISFILVSLILNILTLLMDFSSIEINLTGYLLLYNFINAFLVSVVGSILPIFKEVRL